MEMGPSMNWGNYPLTGNRTFDIIWIHLLVSCWLDLLNLRNLSSGFLRFWHLQVPQYQVTPHQTADHGSSPPPPPFRAQKAAKAGEVASSRWHALVEPLQEKISMLESWFQRFTKHLFFCIGMFRRQVIRAAQNHCLWFTFCCFVEFANSWFFMIFSSSHPRRPIATRSQIHHMTSYLFNHHLRPFAKCRSLCTADICSLEVPGLVVMPCFKEPMKWHEQHHRIHHLFWKILKSIWHVHQFSSTLCIHHACLCDRPRRPPFEQLVREPSKWNQPERGKAGETCNLRRFAIFLSLKGRKEEHGGVEMRQVISYTTKRCKLM